jgi:hypothetical protein
MSTPPVIHWIARAPDLYEARAVLPNGRDVFAGYIAASPGEGVWRGYVGADFSPVGMGPRGVMQRAVEQRVAEIIQRGGIGQQLATFVDGDDQRDSG